MSAKEETALLVTEQETDIVQDVQAEEITPACETEDKKSEQAETDLEKESIRVRKAIWVKQEIERQRAIEDDILLHMMEEQKVLDSLNHSIDDNVELTKESRKYNEDFEENLLSQVYALHGISEDKLEGMKIYKNAYYRGCALAMFLLSALLVVFCGLLHGFEDEITIVMLVFCGAQGALLGQEQHRGRFFKALCGFFDLLLFPAMLGMFILYEFGQVEYKLLLPYFVMGILVILFIGTASYFAYDPYRKEKRRVAEAKDTLREIEKTARKEVKKNRKKQKRDEKRAQKKAERRKKWDERKANWKEKWNLLKGKFHKKQPEETA